MTCVICCFGCLTCCGCRDKVCQRLMFFPPMPFYAIEERAGSGNGGPQTLWLVEEGKRIEPYTSANMRLAFVRTSKGSTVCAMWLRHPGATTTILFSHGNATDIGCLRDHLIDFAKQLKVNVLIYDYTGYGLSAGQPTMAHTLADSEAAYDYLIKTYPAESQRIIVYGQSLGSGPTLHLSRKRRVNGVVVHSGITSAMRVLEGDVTRPTRWFDIYHNIDLIRSTSACVFIMHGTEDKEIPIQHGRGLAEAAPTSFKPWYVEGAGHNNIEVEYREAYFAKLDDFVRYIEATTPHVDEIEDPLQPGQEEMKKGLVAKSPAPVVMAPHSRSVGVSASSPPPNRTASTGNNADPRSMQSPKPKPKRPQDQSNFDSI